MRSALLLLLSLALLLPLLSACAEDVEGEGYVYSHAALDWRDGTSEDDKMLVYLRYGTADDKALLDRFTLVHKGCKLFFNEGGFYRYVTAGGGVSEGTYRQDGETVKCSGTVTDGLGDFKIKVSDGKITLLMRVDERLTVRFVYRELDD